MRYISPLLLAVLAPGIALADPMMETVTSGNALTAAPAAWLGQDPHLVIMGMVDGRTFDVQVMDLDAAEIREITLKREYLLTDTDDSPYRELDFGIQFLHDGIAKAIEGKLTHADFNALPALPASFALQSAEEFPQGDQVFTEFEFKWEAGGVTVDFETADWDGTAVLHLDDAFQAAAPNGDGMVGAYISGTKGDDMFVVSFTLPVTEFEVED